MNTYVIRGLDENSRKVKIEIEAEELEEAVLISKNLCTTVNSVELFDKKQIPKHTSTEGENPLGCGCFPFSRLVKQREDGKYHYPFTKEKFKKDLPKVFAIIIILVIIGIISAIYDVVTKEVVSYKGHFIVAEWEGYRSVGDKGDGLGPHHYETLNWDFKEDGTMTQILSSEGSSSISNFTYRLVQNETRLELVNEYWGGSDDIWDIIRPPSEGDTSMTLHRDSFFYIDDKVTFWKDGIVEVFYTPPD